MPKAKKKSSPKKSSTPTKASKEDNNIGSDNANADTTPRKQAGRPSNDKRFNEKCDLLEQQFKSKHGHCNVPVSHPTLGNWVNNQRLAYRAETLSAARIKKLEDLGFHWNVTRGVSPDETKWDAMLEQLTEYKEKNEGSTNVPYNYEDNPKLGKWVGQQRQLKKSEKLSPERMEQLDAIKFQWEIREFTSWDTRYEQLTQYKSEHNGNIHVPQKHPQLGIWVNNQRATYKQGMLSDDRTKRLEELGFVWYPARGRRSAAVN